MERLRTRIRKRKSNGSATLIYSELVYWKNVDVDVVEPYILTLDLLRIVISCCMPTFYYTFVCFKL